MRQARRHDAIAPQLQKTFAKLLFCAAFLFTFGASLAAAQDEPPPPQRVKPTPTPTPSPKTTTSAPVEDEEVVRVASNLVVVPVSVMNANGEPIQGLKLPDFQLDEEGKLQQLSAVGDPDQVTLELVVLLDVSASVDARFAFEKDAAARFMKSILKPGDSATVYAIDTEPRLVQTRTNADAATQKLLTIGPAKGATAFYDSIIDAVRYLQMKTPPQHRRVIVALTDGDDTNSDRFKTVAQTLPEIQRADTVFYSINPGGQSIRLNVRSVRAQHSMEEMAKATGGAAFVTDTVADTERAFRQIAAELRAQYLLQYYSNSDAPNGKFLSINVRVPAKPDAHIHARQGYYVKK